MLKNIPIISQTWDNGSWSNAQRLSYQYLPNGLEVENIIPIVAYPNPVTNKIQLRSDKLLEGEILVYDLNGKIVLKSKLDPTMPSLDVSSLISGQYFLKLEGLKASRIIPFQKE